MIRIAVGAGDCTFVPFVNFSIVWAYRMMMRGGPWTTR